MIVRSYTCHECGSVQSMDNAFCTACGTDLRAKYHPDTGEELEEPLTPGEFARRRW